MTDHETILGALADGMTVDKAARALGITEGEVRVAWKETADNFRNGDRLREVWALEDIRLHRLGLKFFHKAMEGDGDPHSAVVYVKISERRATLAGANAPIGHAVTVMHQAAPRELTSTQKIRAALDNVVGITVRERELEDKQLYSDEKLSVDEQAELDQLRAEREAKREAKRIAKLSQERRKLGIGQCVVMLDGRDLVRLRQQVLQVAFPSGWIVG